MVNEDICQQLSHCQWLHAFWYVLVYTEGVWHNPNKPVTSSHAACVLADSPHRLLRSLPLMNAAARVKCCQYLILATLHQQAYSSSISDWSPSQTSFCKWEQSRISLQRGFMLKHLLDVEYFVTKSVLCCSQNVGWCISLVGTEKIWKRSFLAIISFPFQ